MRNKLLISAGVLGIIFIAAVIVIFSYGEKDNDESVDKEPSFSENITKEQNINNIVFTDIECDFDGNISLIEYTVVNKTDSIVNLGEYEIIVKDKDGNVLANIVNVLDDDIASGDSVRTGTSINIDLTEADSIELILE